MSNYYEADTLGFDSFDRSGENYYCSSSNACNVSTSASSAKPTTIKSIATSNGRTRIDTDCIVYSGKSLTDAFEELKKQIKISNNRLSALESQLYEFYNNFDSIDKRLKTFENARPSILGVNRSEFKTLRHGGR